MKILLLILLTSVNAFADFKVEIVNHEGQSMSNEFKTELEADNYIASTKHRWGRDAGWLKSDCGNSTGTRTVKNEFDVDVTEYNCPATYSVTKTDITSANVFKKLEAMAAENMACGKYVKAFIGALNVSKGLTQEQIKTLLANYVTINSYLDGGALDTAITEINALVADGTLITGSDKTQIILRIQSCKVTWN